MSGGVEGVVLQRARQIVADAKYDDPAFHALVMDGTMDFELVDFVLAGMAEPLTAPPARTYAEGVEPEPFAYFQRNEGWDMWEQVAHEHRHEEGVVPAYRSPPPALATSRSQHEGAE